MFANLTYHPHPLWISSSQCLGSRGPYSKQAKFVI